MRCPQCSYSLWALKPGLCPECGRVFKPSEFHFHRGAVLFSCPECGQKYQGNDKRGLPAPRQFTCATCECPVDVDAMRAEPAPGRDPESCEALQHPWLDRGDRSLPIALVRTWWAMTTAPSVTTRALRGRRALPSSAAYASILGTGVVVAGLAVVAAWGLMATGSVDAMRSYAHEMLAVCAAALVIALVVVTVWILFAHLMLRMTSNAGASPIGPLRVTAECFLWSLGGSILASIPMLACCSVFLGAGWVAFTTSKALETAHSVSWGRALRATLIPMVLVTILICGGFIGLPAVLLPALARGSNPPLPVVITTGEDVNEAPAVPELPAIEKSAESHLEQVPPAEPKAQPEGDSPDDQFGAEPDPDAGEPPAHGQPEKPGQR